MPERIPATAWSPPQEPADCSVCREAQAALTPDGLAPAAVRLGLCARARGLATIRAWAGSRTAESTDFFNQVALGTGAG
jgi:hypothetical protein